ncbi:PAAR-like domain-containing protein [Photobacterium leiognathi]|uniref:PAAR-like domain-containing protein n=1 Tax=Photobacterium leiognathi TaxID=553611 RepID=UPI00273896B5|nr:PAAR-like domain-containing protein [Photobacterium leiognathi]
MSVTINANGLSIIHQGSGGEANATMPDVCLTTQGKSVVPIPYGNNAKSTDLTGGSTTVSADGGKSIAIKGSQFSKSTGDAGGDKKGISSGTIEAAAKFISASPTVLIEGFGACRLSDQMTMNNGNTMCLGGAQNPSVTVTEDDEGTYTIDLHVTYDDGEGFQAPFKLTDAKNNVFEGQLDAQGRASVSGIAPGLFHLEYGEDQRTYSPTASFTNKNPHFKDVFDPNVLIDEAKIGRIGFWEAGRNTATTSGNWIWGVMIGDLNQDPTSGQLMLSTILSVIPGVDQVMDARDIAVNIFYLTEKENQKNPEYWFGLTLAAIGAIPTIGSVMKGVGKAIQSEKSRDDVFALLRGMGKGNVETFIAEIDWQFIQFQVLQIVTEVIDSFSKVLATLADYADKFGYQAYALEILQFSAQIQDVEKLAHDQLPSAIGYFQQLLDTSMKKGKSSPTRGSGDKRGTSQSGKHDDTAHQDKKNKKPDECWLCEQKVAQKKQEKAGGDYCKEKGFKGKYYQKTDVEFGFTFRGLNRPTEIKGIVYPPNGHYPWDLLKEHGYLSSASPMKHELYLRCYDIDDNGNYIRPHHVWTKKEFEQQQELGIIEKGVKHWPGTILAAHHIITIEMLEKNEFLYKKLPYLGYDVNAWHNIVVLPTIPELACFYEMPLHSGPHPTPYTNNIRDRLEDLEDKIKNSEFCDQSGELAAKQIHKEMVEISEEILELIADFHPKGALNTKRHNAYKTGNKGCCNQLTHAPIQEHYQDLPPCRHRTAAISDISKHHDFRTTQGGIPVTIPYRGAITAALETK